MAVKLDCHPFPPFAVDVLADFDSACNKEVEEYGGGENEMTPLVNLILN